MNFSRFLSSFLSLKSCHERVEHVAHYYTPMYHLLRSSFPLLLVVPTLIRGSYVAQRDEDYIPHLISEKTENRTSPSLGLHHRPTDRDTTAHLAVPASLVTPDTPAQTSAAELLFCVGIWAEVFLGLGTAFRHVALHSARLAGSDRQI
jgi:hypothetical protein